MADTLLTNQPVVFDNGSGMIKAGFAGEEQPKVLCPSFVGRPKHTRVMPGGLEDDGVSHRRTSSSIGTGNGGAGDSSNENTIVVGEKANEYRGLLKLSYPMEHGIIKDWGDMELLWGHCYQQLRIGSEEHPVLLTEAPLNPRANREKAAELFFETFNVPALFVSIQAVLSLYASGRTTGLVLDIGDGVTHTVPIYEGFALPHAIQRTNVAGRDVTRHLQRLLMKSSGFDFHTSAEHEIVKNIKERVCYVATDPVKEEYRVESESRSTRLVDYRLPDSSILPIGPEAFRAPEILFHPSLYGEEYAGAPALLCDSVQRCDLDLRPRLYSNVVLAGGSTLFPGFGERLLHEVSKISPKDVKIKISAPPERLYSTWIGGSILASLGTFRKMWVSREEWREEGASVLHRKCF